MPEGITMIQTQRSGIVCGLLYSYQNALKELEVFGSDLLVFLSERSPLHAIFQDNH